MHAAERRMGMENDRSFSYYLTKFLSEYLPDQYGASLNTVQSYRDTMVQLLVFFRDCKHLKPEKLKYADFTPSVVEEFLHWLENERKISVRTRNQRLAALHSFFRYLQYRDPSGFDQCKAVLSVPYKKVPAIPMSYMSVEEVQHLFSMPDQHENAGIRDLTILVTLYETGARVQELIDMCPADIRFQKTVVAELHGKGNKTRIVPINSEAAAIIRGYICRCNRSNANEPLFVNRDGKKLSRAGIQYIVDKYVSMAREKYPGLYKTRITNHSFRHSRAMHLLEADVNLIYIRDLLGHTSVVTTEIYAKTNPKIKEEQLRKHGAAVETPDRYSKEKKEDLIDWLKKNL